MPQPITMPKLSPTMESGTIIKWHKKEGEKIKSGDLLIEVATDKATVEYNAPDDGFLRKILISEGKEASVNDPIAIMTETKDESIEGFVPEGVKKEAPVASAREEKVVEITKAEPITGGLPLPSFVPEPPLEDCYFQRAVEPFHGRIFASPLAKKMAQEKGIDLTTVKGSGPNGRIVSRDLDLAQPELKAAFGRRAMPEVCAGTYEEEAISPVRKIVGKRLQESKTFIPHFYISQEINADPLFKIHLQLKNQGLKLSYNDFIIRAVALALKEHPEVNSGYNSVHSTIIRFKTIDIAVAVSMENGLITPIIRFADYKNLGEISQEMKRLAKLARDGKLEREEYMGGSFTISNLGMFGVTEMVAVINPPQAAILGVGGIQERAVVEEGRIVAGKRLSFTLSADHRVIDGSDGAKFLKVLKDLLENPAILLIN